MARTFMTPDGELQWECSIMGTFYWVMRNGKVAAIINAQAEGCKQIMTDGWVWPLSVQGDWNVAWPLVEATLAGELPIRPTYEFMTLHPDIYRTPVGTWEEACMKRRKPRVPNDHQWPRPVYALA